ncbi:MAG: insulinase family protein [Betaproteobacteria bacterium]|nr:insulinase family protein [Betaproteobacteria bacterium]
MLPRLLALVLLLAAVPAIAGAPEKVTTIEGVTEYRLTNGLRVLTVPDPSASTVTVHVTYLVGSRHEGYGEKGMAHLLEHLLFKGTKNHPDIKPALTRRGARYNGTTSQDRTTYFETLPASDDNLDWTLGMEADRMVNSNVLKEDLDSEMTVVRNEFEMGENSAAGVLFQRMQRLAFAFHNYGNPIIGARSDIESVPIERLRAFYRTWYQPDNALLIIGGQFDEQRALELVAKHFGPIPRPARTLPQLYTVEPVQDGEREVTLRRTGDIQIVSAMYRMPAAAHPDYPAVDVLVQALGAAPTGRLHRALVHKGLASSAWAYERMMHDPGYAYFGAVLGRQAPAALARDALLATLEKLGEDPIRDEEVERARTGLLASVDKIQVDAGTLVRWLAEFQAVGDWRLLYLYRDRLRAVSTADVRRVALQYLKPANRVLGAFIPTTQPDRSEIPARPDLGAALAGYKGSAPVDAGEAFDASPENIERRVVRRTLGNGMRIALLPKKSRGANVVAQLSLNWGDETSKTARATACSMASGMLGRGTLKRSRAEIRDTLDRLKASVSAGLEGASIEARRGDLEAALHLAAEMLREPAFPPAEFEELKRAALTSAESGRGDPAALAAERLSRHLAPYPNGHWFYTPTTEERIENLRQVTVEDARRCHAELVGATGAEFVAVGDFDPEPLARLVETLFGDWKNPRPYARVPSRYFDRSAIEEQVATPDKANAVLRAGQNLRLRDDHPDFPALVLGNWLLGGNSGARLPARIREQEGLSYSTYSFLNAGQHDEAGRFGISAIYAPENRERVERAMREEIARALAAGFTAAELDSAKKGLLEARRVARSQDRPLAVRLANYLHLGRSFAWDVAFERRLAALTAEEVRAALARHIDPKRISVLKAGDFR